MRLINNILLLLALVHAGMAASQTNLPDRQSGLDALYAVWEDQSQSDSSRVAAYYDYIWDGILFSDPDSAFQLAEALVDYSHNNLFSEAKGYKLQGVSWHIRGDYSKALELYSKSLTIQQEINDSKEVSDLLINIGVLHKNQGNFPKALEYYTRSLKIKEGINDKEGIAFALNNIGLIYQKQGNLPRALEYQLRSLKIKKDIGNKQGIASSLNNIGLIYTEQGNYPKALEYYSQSLAIREEIGDKQGVANSLINIASSYYDQHKYSEALENFSLSLRIQEELGDKQGMASSLNNIGNIYQSQNQYPQALEYQLHSLLIREEIGDRLGISVSLINIGDSFRKQGQYKQAIDHCEKSLVLSEEIGSIKNQKDACRCLYETYKALGKGNEALTYHEQMLVLEDSLKREETGKSLQQMEFSKQMLADSLQQEEEKLKVEMAHQQQVTKKDNMRNLLIGGTLLLLVAAIGFYGRWRYVKKSRDTISKEKDRSDSLLLNILPAEIAEELKEKGEARARNFESVSILFSDFKGFTQASEKLSAADLVAEINTCFKAFDGIVGKYNIEKIKTIGDAYMCAGGLPVPDENSTKNTVLAGLEMQAFMKARKAERDAAGLPAFEMRVGIHTGPVVAGIVGVKKFQYDIWGDTVNTASRMESSGEVGKVNISETTYKLVKDKFSFESRGEIEAKGKGKIKMYFATTKVKL